MSGSISFIYEYGEIDPAEHWCYTKGLENFCVWGQDKLGVREIDLRVRFMKGQASLNTAVEGKPAKSQLRLIREGGLTKLTAIFFNRQRSPPSEGFFLL